MNTDNKDGRKPGAPQNPAQAGQAKPAQQGQGQQPGTKAGAADQARKGDGQNLETGETKGNENIEADESAEDKAARQARTTGGQQGSTRP